MVDGQPPDEAGVEHSGNRSRSCELAGYTATDVAVRVVVDGAAWPTSYELPVGGTEEGVPFGEEL